MGLFIKYCKFVVVILVWFWFGLTDILLNCLMQGLDRKEVEKAASVQRTTIKNNK